MRCSGMGLRILVVGGAGFVGSHMVSLLGELGCEVVTLDNLSGGYRDAVLVGEFVHGDVADRNLLDGLFLRQHFDAVMHFASFIQVGESVREPSKYYQNNVVNTIGLLDAMVTFGVKRFIFSSTAAIFGDPVYTLIDEAHPKNPINPYGASKLMIERILGDYDTAYGLKSVCLRYFNAAGAHPAGHLGERHDPETHLIPLVLRAASGQNAHISIFGCDYDTPDGTCVRDYVHISDLCDAHWLALQGLMDGTGSNAFNLGNGNGFSVAEVIEAARGITGMEIPVIDAPRRSGDSARLVADSRRACQELNWKPRYAELETILAHAWKWERRRQIELWRE